ncbi:hypothetical protein NQ315_006568 [Exocentrus adspersus]|uniref:MADF domain-containing protein n=1 Tax=Exocentrus adspersus TaxID=1586481 RepID=A0AAV8VFM6_9CUCU|nr:hypothetical protein NQ315_006568 [Exocentrus adspersus]
MSNFKWRDNHIIKFLELYQSEECIWNIRREDYKNIMREKSYEKIRSGMEIESLTINDIKNKIKSIRTTYKVELNKILKANKSGAGTDDLYKPKLFWFAHADVFLGDVSVARESQSNLMRDIDMYFTHHQLLLT